MSQQKLALLADTGAKSMRVLEVLTPINAAGAPAVNAKYKGQIYINDTNQDIYIAVKVGEATVLNDWKKVTVA